MTPESSTEEFGAPTDQATDGESVVEDVNQDTAAASPADDQGEEAPSLLDVVTAAAKAETEQENAPDSTEGDEESEEPVEAADDAEATGDDLFDDVPEEELNSYKPKTQRRIKKLLADRESLRKEVGGLKQEVERLHNIDAFIANANLTYDEVNTGFDIMKAMKHDPATALVSLKGYVGQLEQLLGMQLPEELREQVDDGYLDEETALELSQLRSREALASQASQQARQEADALRAQQAANAAQAQQYQQAMGI